MRPVVSALSLELPQFEEMMLERGYGDHTTVYRWVQAYAPELDKRCRTHLKPTNDTGAGGRNISRSKVNGSICIGLSILGFTWTLCARLGCASGRALFRKAMNASHNQTPRVINVDKNAVITSSN